MAINWLAALDVHPQAIDLQNQRADILASNLAHADTPYYLARDFDFHATLKQAMGLDEGLPLVRTSPMHLSGHEVEKSPHVQYRVPFAAAVDNNTVDTHLERTHFVENSLGYLSTLEFLKDSFGGLQTAIQGG